MARQETFKHVSNQMLLEAVKDRNWELASQIVYEDASYAEVYDSAGYLPLHLSVRAGCPPELTIKLLIAHPPGVRLKDPDGNLPLHLSAYHHKGRLWMKISENTTLIYAAYPDAVRQLDRTGNLPIHIAFRYRAPGEQYA
jgi:ankyrin repeat protein